MSSFADDDGLCVGQRALLAHGRIGLFTATIAHSVRDLLKEFEACFTRPGFKNFVALITGWIICQGRHSISRVVQAAGVVGTGKHHSTLYRFLSQGRWTTDDVGRVVFRLLCRFLPEQITLIVDDTLCHKSGPHIFGAAMHYDAQCSTYGYGTTASRKTAFAFGHNWVVAAIWIPLPWNRAQGLAVPILFRLYRSKKRCHQGEHRKRTEIASEMIKIFCTWLPETRRLLVVADSEYSCKTVVRNLPDHVVFTGPMAMDAALYTPAGDYRGMGRPRRKGKRLPSPKVLARSRSKWKTLTVSIYGKDVAIQIKTMACLWYTVAGTKLVQVVVTRDPTGRIQDRAYFTTAVDCCSAEEILVGFARRWEIEVSFRSTKQNLGLEDPQNGWWHRPKHAPRQKKRPGPNPRGRIGEKAINHTLACVFVSYAITIAWYLSHGQAKRDVQRARTEAPWYRHKKHPSFNDMLAAIRRELWIDRLSQHPGTNLGRAEVDAILPHWHLAA